MRREQKTLSTLRAWGFVCTFAMATALIVSGNPAITAAPPTKAASKPAKTNTVIITRAQFTKTVNVRKGDNVEIRLESNPSTGYTWVLEQSNKKILTALGNETLPPKKNSRGPAPAGAPGTQVFRFKAIGRGPSAVRLVYKRPWDTSGQVANAFRVTVYVR